MRVVALTFLSFLVSPALSGQEGPPIIDMHLHVYPVGALGPAGIPNPATGRPSPETDEGLRRENVAALERFNIVRAVTSLLPGSRSRVRISSIRSGLLVSVSDEVIWVTAGTTHWIGSPREAGTHDQFRREYLGPRRIVQA